VTDGSLVPALVELGIVILAFVVAFTLDRRYVGADRKLRALPGWVQILVAGIAMSPFLAHTRGLLPATVVDDTVLMVVLMFALWIALPAVAFRLLDPDPAERRVAC
jgi:hypothetical protein